MILDLSSLFYSAGPDVVEQRSEGCSAKEHLQAVEHQGLTS